MKNPNQENNTLNIPIYSSDEMVRLELLAYSNPDGLHAVEESWKNLARKLLEHIKEVAEKHHTKGSYEFPEGEYCRKCGWFMSFKFPEAYNPNKI